MYHVEPVIVFLSAGDILVSTTDVTALVEQTGTLPLVWIASLHHVV